MLYSAFLPLCKILQLFFIVVFFLPSRVDLFTTGPKAPELKGRARGKPSLLAAARPMRAILPAPTSVGRGSSVGLPRARQAFPLGKS